jgi:pyruvate kinase
MPDCATKIVATLGPASARPEVLARLLDAGVAVVRINFSHGTRAQHTEYIQMVRAAAGDRPVAIMGDMCGPKIRLGSLEHGACLVRPGDSLTIQRTPLLGRDFVVSTNYAGIVDDLEPGQRVLIDDGAIRMICTDKTADAARCQVTVGGVLQDHKGVNLPNTEVRLPSVTEKDWSDIDFAIAQQLDYIALSFVRSADDVTLVRRHLARKASAAHVVSKIEKPQAVRDLEAIVEASDAVLVARGDLGVELELTSVPIVQKQIVASAHAAGKPVIVATQMLQSMVDAAAPTRAEVSDVANAILDGADACMLSGETAVGKYPVGAVHMLRQIAEHTEVYQQEQPARREPPRRLQELHHRTAAIAHGARVLVSDLDARLMVVWSEAGGSARYLSKNRLPVPIFAFSSSPAAVRRMALYYGVTPHCEQIPPHFDDLPGLVDRVVHAREMAAPGDRVVIMAGAPLGIVGVTNSLSVHTVGEY